MDSAILKWASDDLLLKIVNYSIGTGKLTGEFGAAVMWELNKRLGHMITDMQRRYHVIN